jgi:hypothetical protein
MPANAGIYRPSLPAFAGSVNERPFMPRSSPASAPENPKVRWLEIGKNEGSLAHESADRKLHIQNGILATRSATFASVAQSKQSQIRSYKVTTRLVVVPP